jgi:hypothetical protein
MDTKELTETLERMTRLRRTGLGVRPEAMLEVLYA